MLKPVFQVSLALALANALLPVRAFSQEIFETDAHPGNTKTYLVTRSSDDEDRVEFHAVVQTSQSRSSHGTVFNQPASPIELFPIASVRVSRELLASLSFGVIFSTDTDISLYDDKDAFAVKLLEVIFGIIRYHAAGPSLQAEIGITGAKVSVGYTEIAGSNFAYILPVTGMGYSIKASALHKWSGQGNSFFQTGDEGATYFGPEIDFMYQFVKMSLGLMKRISGPDHGNGDWILTAGVGLGL